MHNRIYLLHEHMTDAEHRSDGTQPHIVTIQFPKKVSIVALGIYSVLKLDESYTPHRIAIRCGATACDAYVCKSKACLFFATPQQIIISTGRCAERA